MSKSVFDMTRSEREEALREAKGLPPSRWRSAAHIARSTPEEQLLGFAERARLIDADLLTLIDKTRFEVDKFGRLVNGAELIENFRTAHPCFFVRQAKDMTAAEYESALATLTTQKA